MFGKRLTIVVWSLALLLAPLHITLTQKPLWAVAQVASSATTWYVDRAATGRGNTGGSWADAYTSLQPALSAAQAGDQIWVATGVYTPTNTTDRTATFTLVAGVTLYGGFDPASGADAWAECSWLAHPTVLSGDLGGNDLTGPNGVVTSTANIVGSNAYHVFSSSRLTETARLDGFYVTAGKADGSDPYDRGGGMYNYLSSPSLVNATFAANQATFSGGMGNFEGSSPSLVNVIFAANQANTTGGGSSTPTATPASPTASCGTTAPPPCATAMCWAAARPAAHART